MRSVDVNQTLHGRSVFRPENVRHHNVFKGFNSPGTGDAIDLFCASGTEVFAVEDGVQTVLRSDAFRSQVIYLEGEGFTAVYAHIDARVDRVNARFSKGDVLGTVGGHLNHPHLHFELWQNGRAVNARSAGKLRMKMLHLMGVEGDEGDDSDPRLIVAKPGQGPMSLNDLVYNELPSRYDHRGGEILVDTQALAEWLGRSATGMPHFLHIREAIERMGLQATFNLDHLASLSDPRVYAFITGL